MTQQERQTRETIKMFDDLLGKERVAEIVEKVPQSWNIIQNFIDQRTQFKSGQNRAPNAHASSLGDAAHG